MLHRLWVAIARGKAGMSGYCRELDHRVKAGLNKCRPDTDFITVQITFDAP